MLMQTLEVAAFFSNNFNLERWYMAELQDMLYPSHLSTPHLYS